MPNNVGADTIGVVHVELRVGNVLAVVAGVLVNVLGGAAFRGGELVVDLRVGGNLSGDHAGGVAGQCIAQIPQ